MSVSSIGRNWSKKARCYSREVREEEFIQARVILTDDDIALFCLSRKIRMSVSMSAG